MNYFSQDFLHNLLETFDEIRFNNERNGESIPTHVASNEQTNSKSFDFAIKRDSYEKFIINNKNCEIFRDAYSCKENDTNKRLSNSAMFLYGKEENGKTDFLFGFDPEKTDLWRLNPEQDRGLKIQAKNYTRIFKTASGVAGIENLDFTIYPSEFVGIYGNSGAGKTTLLEAMIAPSAKETLGKRIRKKLFGGKAKTGGQILFGEGKGKGISSCSKEIAYLPQDVNFPKNLTCETLLNLAMRDRGATKIQNGKNTIDYTLSMCSLTTEILSRNAGDLSGGQRRRLALAMALLKKNVKLLVLDEPTTGLDIKSEISVMKTLKRISRHGITVVVVTHSVAALRLFDRVLVLRKSEPDHGASVCFQSLWNEKSFKKASALEKIPNDADRLSFLADPNSGVLLKDLEANEYKWPYRDSVEYSEHKGKRWQKLFSDWRSFLATMLKQYPVWLNAAAQLILKDRKQLFQFALLAICCVLIIQLGIVKAGSEGDRQLVSMFTICAPWLCATYAAVFLNDLRKFFALEKFSGLRTFNFVGGVFTAHLIPALLLAFIFSAGIWFRPDHKNIADHMLACQTKTEILEIQKTRDQATLDEQKENLHQKLRYLNKFLKKNEVEKFTERTAQDLEYSSRFADYVTQPIQDFKPHYSKIEKPGTPSFLHVSCGMLFICLLGASLGIFVGALFRKSNAAMISLVVMFIFFLMFGRLFALNPNIQEPLGRIFNLLGNESWGLEYTETGAIIPLIASFITIARYAFNLVYYPFENMHQLWLELLPLLGFMGLALGGAVFILSNKSRNWKMLSR